MYTRTFVRKLATLFNRSLKVLVFFITTTDYYNKVIMAIIIKNEKMV